MCARRAPGRAHSSGYAHGQVRSGSITGLSSRTPVVVAVADSMSLAAAGALWEAILEVSFDPFLLPAVCARLLFPTGRADRPKQSKLTLAGIRQTALQAAEDVPGLARGCCCQLAADRVLVTTSPPQDLLMLHVTVVLESMKEHVETRLCAAATTVVGMADYPTVQDAAKPVQHLIALLQAFAKVIGPLHQALKAARRIHAHRLLLFAI